MTSKQATIYLNVPAGLKARLVKASQRRSMKLTDYLLELIERAEAMNTHAIPESPESPRIPGVQAGEDVNLRRICASARR